MGSISPTSSILWITLVTDGVGDIHQLRLYIWIISLAAWHGGGHYCSEGSVSSAMLRIKNKVLSKKIK